MLWKGKKLLNLMINYSFLLKDKDILIHFIEAYMDFGEELERYTVVYNSKTSDGYRKCKLL